MWVGSLESPWELAIVGPLQLIAGIVIGLRKAKFRRTAAHAEGKVTAIQGSGKNAFPVIEFVAGDGVLHTFKADVGTSPPSYSVGQPVKVVYDPARRDKASIDTFFQQWFLTILCFAVGGIWTWWITIPVLLHKLHE